MSQLKCDFRVVGPVQTNCYFLSDTNGNCVVVDPGEEAARIIDYIEKKDLKPVAILLTHGHFDHIGAVDEVREKYDIKVYAAAAEKETLQNTDINLSSQFGAGDRTSRRKSQMYSDTGAYKRWNVLLFHKQRNVIFRRYIVPAVSRKN